MVKWSASFEGPPQNTRLPDGPDSIGNLRDVPRTTDAYKSRAEELPLPTTKPTDDTALARRARPLSLGAWVTVFGLVGAYAGWWGEGFFAWIPAGGLVAANIIGWSSALFIDWLRRSLQIGVFPMRGLLGVVVAFGIVGGVLVGLMLWLPAALSAAIVKGIDDDAFRTAAGAGLGIVLGAICSWAASRSAKQQARIQATDDSGDSTNLAP